MKIITRAIIWTFPFVLVTIAVVTSASAAENLSIPSEIGVQKPISIEVNSSAPQTTITDIGATFIKLHAEGINLIGSDTLTVSSSDGSHTVTLTATDNRPSGLWLFSIPGESVNITLNGNNTNSSVHFHAYLRGGFPETTSISAQPQPEAICGVDNKQEAACYTDTRSVEFGLSSAVARILFVRSGLGFVCTAWRVGPADNTMMTNNHCIASANDLSGAEVWFNYQNSACNGNDAFSNRTVVGVSEILTTSQSQDVTLFTVDNPSAIQQFGFLTLDNRAALSNERIFIPQYPGGRDKEMAVFSDFDSGDCLVNDPADAGGRTTYSCDTEGGSSGSPVIALSSNKVIALHFAGSNNCKNFGKRAVDIYPIVIPFLDTDAPLANITNPGTNNQQLPASTRLGGTASDDGGSGFSSVIIALQDLDSGKFLDWDTNEFTPGLKTTETNLKNTFSTSTRWDKVVIGLQEGNYRVNVSAIDIAGNQRINENGNVIWTRRDFTVKPADKIPPLANITNPGTNLQYLPASTRLGGTASDEGGSGFDVVLIALQDVVTNRFLDWNTNQFTAGLKTTEANLKNTTDSSTRWDLVLNSLPPGTYRVNASAVDKAGNQRVNSAGNVIWTRRDFQVDHPDSIAPIANITNPASNNMTLPGNTRLGGTASDEGGAGFESVLIALQDLNSPGHFLDWDTNIFNAGLKTTVANLKNITLSSTRWDLIVRGLAPGTYRVNVSAIDGAGNQRLNAAGNVIWTRRDFVVSAPP